MIEITNAVLHILDFNSNITVFSEQELDLDDSQIFEFLVKHIEKAYNDLGQKNGTFWDNSTFVDDIKKLETTTINFIEFSTNVAIILNDYISKSDRLVPTDIIICNFKIDDFSVIGILGFNNRTGFTHQVIKTDGKIKNSIINHYSILPNTSQKADFFAFINLKDLSVKFHEKKYFINGKDVRILPEVILQCTSSISQKDTLKIVENTACKVAEKHGESSIAILSKAKNYIGENAEISDYIEPVDFVKNVFHESEIMQEEFLKEVESAGLKENIKVDRTFAVKSTKKHKIKTDTGIEIIFPSDYFQNKDYIEIINNPDGTLSIEIKNIRELINASK